MSLEPIQSSEIAEPQLKKEVPNDNKKVKKSPLLEDPDGIKKEETHHTEVLESEWDNIITHEYEVLDEDIFEDASRVSVDKKKSILERKIEDLSNSFASFIYLFA